MPRRLVAPRVVGCAPSLEIPRAIALEFSISIPASAIRYVQLTKERCAVVYSERGTVQWASRSHRFAGKIEKDAPVSRSSYAYECAGTQDLDDRARAVDAIVWFDAKEPIAIVEHSAPVSEASGVITLLWVPEPVAAVLWPSQT